MISLGISVLTSHCYVVDTCSYVVQLPAPHSLHMALLQTLRQKYIGKQVLLAIALGVYLNIMLFLAGLSKEDQIAKVFEAPYLDESEAMRVNAAYHKATHSASGSDSGPALIVHELTRMMQNGQLTCFGRPRVQADSKHCMCSFLVVLRSASL